VRLTPCLRGPGNFSQRR